MKILLCLESNLKRDENCSIPSLLRLKHPRTDSESLFLYNNTNKQLEELIQFSEKNRSWFIDEQVVSDGSLIISVPVDPLLFILPYLQNNKHFCSLDDILLDDEFKDCKYLKDVLGKYNIDSIADSKDFDDTKVYKFNKTKMLEWLKSKTERLEQSLKSQAVAIDNGSAASNFKEVNPNQEGYLEYSFGIISEYISENHSKDLRTFIGLPAVIEIPLKRKNKETAEESQEKLKRSKSGNEPTEDYAASKSSGIVTKGNSKSSKMSVTQKQLLKVDKKGMKSIQSFFTKK